MVKRRVSVCEIWGYFEGNNSTSDPAMIDLEVYQRKQLTRIKLLPEAGNILLVVQPTGNNFNIGSFYPVNEVVFIVHSSAPVNLSCHALGLQAYKYPRMVFGPI